MHDQTLHLDAVKPSTSRYRAGLILSALPVLFLVFDAVGKLMRIQPVREGMAQLGYPAEATVGLGIIRGHILLHHICLDLTPRAADGVTSCFITPVSI